jgi:3-oxoacyl-[acyl-carrier protein] reductase
MNEEAGDLRGRVAIVTGAGQGIGEGIAASLARRGARVVVNDLLERRATDAAARIADSEGTALGIAADVSDPVEVERLMMSATEAFGPITIVVNNAATFCNKPFLDHSLEDWDRLFAVNVRGVFLCCRAVLPVMIERGEGSIVNVASISAFHTTADHVAYAASKAAIVAMTRDIAAEVAGYGIRVNSVAPGPIGGPAFGSADYDKRSAGVTLPRAGRPADIGDTVAFLASDAAGWITGQTLPVAGGADLRVAR